MDVKRFLSAVLVSLIVTTSYAAIDPVSWVSSSANLPSQTTVGNSYTLVYIMTNNLPRPVPLTVSASFDGGAFSLSHGCNTTLAPKNQPNSNCMVTLQFQPNKEGANRVNLTMRYHNNVVPLPTLNSNTSQMQGIVKGFITKSLPSITYTGAAYPVEFTYYNPGATAVTTTSVLPQGFTPTSNTCTNAIPANGSCKVAGSFSPTVVGSTALSVVYNYTYGSANYTVPLTTQTTVQNGAGCHQIIGSSTLPLPTKTYIYADNVVQYVFTNFCPAQEVLGTVNLSSDSSATLNKGLDTCSGATLSQNQSCKVEVSVTPTATASDLTVTAMLPYLNGTLSASVSTSELVQAIPNQSSSHTLMFVNQCDYPVWYEFTNGTGGGAYPSSPDPTPANARTFADYQINQQIPGLAPFTKVLTITEYQNGAIYARTGCNALTGVCETANCPVIPGTATCQLGTQPSPPQTKFELNMLPSGFDGIYDVSVINGFNVPGEVHSMAAVFTGATPPGNIPYPFNCGQSAGALIQASNNSLGACPWTFTPPATLSPDTPANYQWVTGGSAGANCTQDSDCVGSPLGAYCGMTSPDPVDGRIYRRCGNFLGYWTLADYIGLTSPTQWDPVYDLYTAYNMGTALQPAGTGVTDYGTFLAGSPPVATAANYAAMYGCITTSTNALNTGYNTQATNNDKVCGCYDWNQGGSSAPTAQVTPCTGFNSQWLSTVYPRILWLKQACPTAYSYQFDDKSSQFQCNESGKQTSYQITFCPGGRKGVPATS